MGFCESTDGAYTSERSTDTPTGTGYSLKLQVTTADTSIAAAQYSYILHEIEAQNLQSLQYGTSSAKTLTLSFWVKSNKTGTYTIDLVKRDSTAYYIPVEYTISSANTWEKKTITITPTAGSTSLSPLLLVRLQMIMVMVSNLGLVLHGVQIITEQAILGLLPHIMHF